MPKLLTFVGHGNTVAAGFICLVMQRLSDVAKEVNQKLERLLGVGHGKAAIAHPLGVVDNGRDRASRGATVAIKVDVAGRRGVVLGVNVVQRSRPRAIRLVPVAVCPRGDVGQVRVRGVVENALGPKCSCR